MADSRLLDRRPHEVAPLRPGAVIVLHVRVAEEVLQDEPGVGRPLPDPAVCDDLLVRRDAFAFVEGLEILSRLERAVLVDGLGPGNVLRPGNVPASLRVLRRIFRRREDLSREFLRRSHVDEDFVLLLDRLPHVVQVYAEGLVRFLRREGRLGERGDVLRDREILLDPLLPTAVQEDDVVDAVVLEHPEDERGEPVVEVPVKDDFVVVRDAQPAEERLEALFRDDVSAHRIVDVLLPVDQDGPRDVPEVVVRRRIVIDLDDADVLIAQTSFHPARVDQYFGMRVCRHGFHASDASEVIRCYILCSYRYSYPTKRGSTDGISINTTQHLLHLRRTLKYPEARCLGRRRGNRPCRGGEIRESFSQGSRRNRDLGISARIADRGRRPRRRPRRRFLDALHPFPSRRPRLRWILDGGREIRGTLVSRWDLR